MYNVTKTDLLALIPKVSGGAWLQNDLHCESYIGQVALISFFHNCK